MVWLDMERPAREEFSVLKEFGLHPLTIEDCINYQSLPKIDTFPAYLFLVMHGIHYDPHRKETKKNEIDFVCGKNYLITVHREGSFSVNSVKERCGKNPEIMAKGPDIVMHAVIDSMIDRYFPVVDYWDERIEEAEGEILAKKTVLLMIR